MITDRVDLTLTDQGFCCAFCAGKAAFSQAEGASTAFQTKSTNSIPSYVAALLPDGTPKWGGTVPGVSAVVTYSFMEAAPSYADSSDRFGFSPFSDSQKAAAIQALTAWSDVSGIEFVQVSDTGIGGFLRFGTNNQQGVSSGYAYYPSSNDSGGDVYLANDQATNNNLAPGGYGYLTLLHEIGHAIGLKHPGNYSAGGGAVDGPFLPSAQDSAQYSLMSYNDHGGVSAFPAGPALYDIAAIQYLYGVNTSTNSTDNVYAFSNPNVVALQTIWDTGGNDTINISGQTSGATVSLIAGSFSSIGTNGTGGLATNNVSISYGVEIENVIGGSGNDVITGNASDNILTGGAGSDTIYGGTGTDASVFNGARSQYSWSTNGGSTTIVGPDGRDTLTSVEILRFGDGSANLVAENPVFRFYNSISDTHFYTGSEAERDGILATVASFVYEGQNFATSSSGETSAWRFYNTSTDSHFYTISIAERDWIIENLPTFNFEGEAYKARDTPADGFGPLYRFLNTQNGAHFFTASAVEAELVEANIPYFNPEGVAYYVGLL
jgi:serralysin